MSGNTFQLGPNSQPQTKSDDMTSSTVARIGISLRKISAVQRPVTMPPVMEWTRSKSLRASFRTRSSRKSQIDAKISEEKSDNNHASSSAVVMADNNDVTTLPRHEKDLKSSNCCRIS